MDKSLLPNNASQLLRDLEKAGSGISRLKIINDLINIHRLVQTYSCLGWHGVFLLMFGMKLGP